MMRLRQVAVAAKDCDRVVDDLCAVLGIEVAYVDPGVEMFGLRNAVMPMRDTFLEVVSPTEPDTAAGRYMDRMGGDAGYMLLFQTDDFDAALERFEAAGVRRVWSADLPDIRATHLHPRDTGGALCSIDQPEPPESWRWGGPDWRAHIREDVSGGIVGAVLESPAPEALARRFAQLLDVPVLAAGAAGADAFELSLDRGQLRFEASPPDAQDRLVRVLVECVDVPSALATARARGFEVSSALPGAEAVRIAGVWFQLRNEAASVRE